MRRVWYLWLACWVSGVLILTAPAALLAQASDNPIQVFVLPPVTTSDNGSTLGIRVPFRLLDAEGNRIDNARITDMNLELVNMPPGAINFALPRLEEIRPVETPLYVSLVIDASTSMSDYIEQVRAAAIAAIGSAPSNVIFRVVSFRGQYSDPQITVRQDFTDDRLRVLRAISDITIEKNSGTCYYDAVHHSLEDLTRLNTATSPAPRKAIIAFTDGYDMVERTEVPCSRHTVDEVIQSARSQQIPVYTIGMYGNDPTKINRAALANLATNTGATAAIGGESEIDALFRQAFAGIVNQFEVEFAALPKGGRNEAYLRVWLAGSSEPVTSAVFSFNSPRSFLPTPSPVPPTLTPAPTPTPLPTPLPPAAAVQFAPRAAQPDPAGATYRFSLSIDNPRIIDQLILRTLDKNGIRVDEQIVVLDGRTNLSLNLSLALLKPDMEYEVQVQAVGKDGALIARPQQENEFRNEDPTLLDSLVFTHVVDKAPPLTAAIRSIRPDADSGVLIVELDVNQPELVDDYQAFINDESGQKVEDTGMQVYPGGVEVAVPMPRTARQAVDDPQPLEFNLSIRLRTPQNADTDTDPFAFKLTPPARPTFFATLWTGLEQNPLVAIAIVVVLSSVVLWFVFGRRPARPAYSLARSAEEYTVVAGAAASSGGKRHGKLLVDVFDTPSPGERKKQSFNRFPCVIGRSSQCDVRLAGDSQLSRRHAQLVLENGRILLTDLGSNNRTFVDEQPIDANTAVPLSDGQVIRLGPQTRIRVSVSYH